jgi:hypothetical protein
VLSSSELASHTHIATDSGHTHDVTDSGHQHNTSVKHTSAGGSDNEYYSVSVGTAVNLVSDAQLSNVTVDSGTANVTLSSVGDNEAHNNIQPSHGCIWVMKMS